MLAHALVLNRDLQLTGQATSVLVARPTSLSDWNRKLFPTRDQAIGRQQPNVRAMNADMEVMSGIHIEDTSKPGSKVCEALVIGEDSLGNRKQLVSITLPTDGQYESLLARQTVRVLNYADLRGERVNEIVSQVVPQVAFWSAIAGLQPDRHRYTLELLGVGLRFATLTVQRLKFLLNVPRPMDISPLVQPIILTPGHSAFPSGHATEASFAAELLAGLHATALPNGPSGTNGWDLPDNLAKPLARLGSANHAASLRTQLHRLAYRIAENRVVAGVHFPMDSVAGQLLGVTLAHYFLSLASSGNGFGLPELAGLDLSKHNDRLIEPATDKPLEPDDASNNPPLIKLPTLHKPVADNNKQRATVLKWLWAQAKQEL